MDKYSDYYNCVKKLKYLESKGFNIYEKNNYNQNALDLVLKYKNSKRVIKYISKNLMLISFL